MDAEVIDVDAPALDRRMTLEEFLALPQGPPHYEYEQGEVLKVPSAQGDHQDISGNLYLAMKERLRASGEGRVWLALDVFLPQARVYVPDLVFLAKENLDRYAADGDKKIHGVPDLVVEIVSPGGGRRDRFQKFNAYGEAGVPWYWLVEGQTLAIEEYHLLEAGYVRTAAAWPGDTFRPQAFPGLEIPVDGLTE